MESPMPKKVLKLTGPSSGLPPLREYNAKASFTAASTEDGPTARAPSGGFQHPSDVDEVKVLQDNSVYGENLAG